MPEIEFTYEDIHAPELSAKAPDQIASLRDIARLSKRERGILDSLEMHLETKGVLTGPQLVLLRSIYVRHLGDDD